eukprot:6214289-Pleurochrysis_carterae.AAC.1
MRQSARTYPCGDLRIGGDPCASVFSVTQLPLLPTMPLATSCPDASVSRKPAFVEQLFPRPRANKRNGIEIVWGKSSLVLNFNPVSKVPILPPKVAKKVTFRNRANTERRVEGELGCRLANGIGPNGERAERASSKDTAERGRGVLAGLLGGSVRECAVRACGACACCARARRCTRRARACVCAWCVRVMD